jgi:hypothetical protein
MNKNTGIELPILEGPESIMLAIMEVQRALLDARIDRQMAHTLLYSLQLAIQLKVHSYSGLSDKIHSVATCPELDQELELDRARGLRPAATQCLSCRQKDSCLSPKTCSKLPLRAEVQMEAARLEAVQVEADPAEAPRVEQAFRPASKPALETPSSRPERSGVEGPAVSAKSTSLSLKTSTLNLVSS